MSERKRKILAINGNTKSTSTCLSILEFIKKKFQSEIELNIYNRITDLPHFNPEKEKDLPFIVEELRDLIKQADGVLFCTPEYVFSLPGALKNLIEWNVSTVLFSAKPVAIIVAAASGKKAFASLDLILTTIECTLPIESKLLIQAAKGKIKSEGEIDDPEILSNIDRVILSLLSTIDSSIKVPTKYLNN